MSDPSTDERTRTVEIPERTAERISTRLTGTEFDSIDDYVAFALDQLLRELDRQSKGEDRRATSEKEASDDGITGEAVKERLESLGYL
jgi:Arc/MetJ-type ribon-helix-helix transcriptional regulator